MMMDHCIDFELPPNHILASENNHTTSLVWKSKPQASKLVSDLSTCKQAAAVGISMRWTLKTKRFTHCGLFWDPKKTKSQTDGHTWRVGGSSHYTAVLWQGVTSGVFTRDDQSLSHNNLSENLENFAGVRQFLSSNGYWVIMWYLHLYMCCEG